MDIVFGKPDIQKTVVDKIQVGARLALYIQTRTLTKGRQCERSSKPLTYQGHETSEISNHTAHSAE